MSDISVGNIGLNLVLNHKTAISDGVRQDTGRAGRILSSFTGTLSGHFGRMEQRTSSFASNMTRLIGGAFAVRKLVDFGKACLDLGSDLEEVQNVVDVAFGDMSSQIDSWAQGAARAFGLSETMAKRYSGTYGSMAKAFGFSKEDAAAMSTTLAGLAGDVASFYNIDQDSAYTKLKSVFTGETESLKDLGVVMTQTALDSFAMANGFGRTTQQMSESEKVALRYQFVLQNLSDASGDFSRTSGSWANQMRILNLQFGSLKATIGQGLINVLTPVVKWLNTILAGLTTVANAFKSFTELLTGGKSSGQTQLSALTEDLGNVSSAGSDAAGAIGSVGDAAEGAGAAAQKAMRFLAGFDKITKAAESSSGGSGGSGSGSGGGSGGSGSSLGTTVDYGSLADSSEFKFKGLENLGASIAQSVSDQLSKIPWDTVYEKARGFGTGLADFLNGLFDPQYDLFASIGTTIAGAINTKLNASDAFAGRFNFTNLGVSLGEGVNAFMAGIDWDTRLSAQKGWGAGIANTLNGFMKTTDWSGVGRTAGNYVVTSLQGIASFVKTADFGAIGTAFADALKGVPWGDLAGVGGSIIGGITKGAIDFLKGAFGEFAGNIKKTFVEGFNEQVELLTGAGVPLGDAVMAGIGKGIGDVIGAGAGWFKENILDPFVNGFKEAFGIHSPASAPSLVEAAGFVGEGILQGIGAKFLDIGGWVQENIVKKFSDGLSKAKGFVTDVTINAKAKADKTFSNIKKSWDSVKTKTTSLTAKAKDASGKVLSTIKSTWDKVKDRTSTLTGTAKNKASGTFDKLTSAWNTIKTKTATVTGKAQNSTGSTLQTIKDAFASVKDKVATITGRAKNDNPSTLSTLKGSWENVYNKTATLTATAKFTSAIDAIPSQSKVIQMRASITGVEGGGALYRLASGGIFSGGSWHKIAAYADGVSNAPTGQLFMAREAGPELVGTIGGHTAVLNNQQIVGSVAAGVAAAVARVLSQIRIPMPVVAPSAVAPAQMGAMEQVLQEIQLMNERNDAQVVALLTEILEILKALDLTADVDIDRLRMAIVARINNRTRATGRCEIAF